MENITSKVCAVCKDEKPLTEFWKGKTCTLGRVPNCVKCSNELWRDKYRKDVVRLRARQRLIYQKDKLKIKRRAHEKYLERKSLDPEGLKLFNKVKNARFKRNNPGRLEIMRRKYNYGLDDKKYLEILEFQNGRCAGCFKLPIPGKHVTRLCVDHNHDTKKVRGLLCNNCNFGIGFLEENTKTLKRLISYLDNPTVSKLKESSSELSLFNKIVKESGIKD